VRSLATAALLALVLTACSGGDDGAGATTTPPASITTTAASTTATAGLTTTTGTATPVTGPPPFEATALPSDRGEFFSASGVCVVCHQSMTDATGTDVSIDAAWRSTMMANAARDPYWQATVASEMLATPALAEVIQDKCLTCHSPMARTTAAFGGETAAAFDGGMLDPQHALHPLAIDGVSCTACHQIRPDGLGTEETFSGKYVIDSARPAGERLVYGTYAIPPGLANQMQASSGFIPVQGTHIQESDLCGACHALITPSVNAAGEILGEFPEQMTYVEWLASSYADHTSCQDCHLPEAEGAVQLSVTGGPPRGHFSQHHFVGGNSFVLSMFRAFGEEIGVTAASNHFDATIARTGEQLTRRTATVEITGAAVNGDQIETVIRITNLAGHKFPSGFPSRRAWLHFTVRDGTGAVVFESGAWAPNGSIPGNDNDESPSLAEPHYETITAPDQVQIYETITIDTDARISTTVLRIAGYWKDNRLLPDGFDKAILHGRTAVVGAAAIDDDFVGGSDTVTYLAGLGGVAGPFTVDVELLYQTVAFRWAENLDADHPAVTRFQQYRSAVSATPVVVATAAVEVAG